MIVWFSSLGIFSSIFDKDGADEERVGIESKDGKLHDANHKTVHECELFGHSLSLTRPSCKLAQLLVFTAEASNHFDGLQGFFCHAAQVLDNGEFLNRKATDHAAENANDGQQER